MRDAVALVLVLGVVAAVVVSLARSAAGCVIPAYLFVAGAVLVSQLPAPKIF